VILWLVLAAMTAAAVAVLLRPLLRGQRTAPPSREAYDRAVYRDQLAELERDAARGLIGVEEARAAEREIARRLLATAADAGAPPAEAPRADAAVTLRRWAAFAVIALVPLASLALYLALGVPGAPDFPFRSRDAALRAQGMPDIPAAIARLEARLKAHPDELQGWLLLARSYAALQQFDKAAEAYRKAEALSGERPEIVSAAAEMLVMAAGGTVTAEARRMFEAVHARQPDEVRARFYIGLAKSQEGDGAGAIADWRALESAAPTDAPWLPALRQQIQRVARDFQLDPAKIAPAPPPAGAPSPQAAAIPSTPQPPSPPAAASGPSQADIAAVQGMSPAQRAELVRGMVARLAARLEQSPDDLAGWRQLGRSYRVLGEHDKAADAFAHAAKLAPGDADVLVDYGEALIAARPGAAPPAEAVAVMRRVLAIDGNRREALWFVGQAEAEAGDKAKASALWQRLLGELAPGTPEYEQVRRRLAALGAPR
jgi:cytochrome c-type biogenesis protein CcmH